MKEQDKIEYLQKLNELLKEQRRNQEVLYNNLISLYSEVKSTSKISLKISIISISLVLIMILMLVVY